MIKHPRRCIRKHLIKISVYGGHAGAITLIMTLVLLLLSTMIIIFAANYGILLDKAIANINRNNQAFEAAEAGLEYAINYLNTNSSNIIQPQGSGYMQPYSDGRTNNVTLSNNSKYTITYSNPVANDYSLIKISSTGTSNDGTSTRTVSQLVKFGSMLLNQPNEPLDAKGSVALSNNSNITNNYNNTTIKSASSVSLSDAAQTDLSSGTSSTAGNIQSDIIQNDTTFANLSSSDFFNNYFGLSQSMVKSSVANVISKNSDFSYRETLNGQSGTSFWLDQTGGVATINGFSIIGSSSNPVLLIVNGNTSMTGFVIIFGFVYNDGTISIASGASIYIFGGLVSTGNLSGSGTLQVYYSPNILTNLQTQTGMQYYAKIPGSWKDF